MSIELKKKKCGSRPILFKGYDAQQVNVDETNRKVSGYLASFNTIDSDSDMIIKGAFAKSLAERGVNSTTARKIAYLWQHDMKEPIGKFTELKEDDFGLYFEAELDDIELGNRVLKQYKSGTLNQHSIGFKYVWDKTEFDEDKEAYILKEVNLFEGSVVTLGMNENTPFTGMKAFDMGEQSASLTKETEMFLKSLSPELEYQARQLISKHIALTEAKEPHKALQTDDKPQLIDITEYLKTAKFIK